MELSRTKVETRTATFDLDLELDVNLRVTYAHATSLVVRRTISGITDRTAVWVEVKRTSRNGRPNFSAPRKYLLVGTTTFGSREDGSDYYVRRDLTPAQIEELLTLAYDHVERFKAANWDEVDPA